ncbi:ATP-binding protein [Enterobacter hormaechei]|nr:ATP-binding protein [Enterobacter hormaechei]
MNKRESRSLWRWICVRVLSLAAGSVVLIALCMWLRFALLDAWVQNRMPEPVRQEFLHLRENPDLNRIRYHEIIDDWYGLQFSDPSIASTDWLTLGGLVLFVTPLIIMLGLLAARPLARQFGLLTRASAAIAQGRFTTRSKLDASAPSELMLFTQNFNTMAERLERYDRELRASHVAAAHELRSPLTAAVGRLRGMMDGVFPPDKAQMNMVMNQLQSLSRLIDDLHLLSLADAGQLTLNKQRFSPAGLLQEKIAWLRPQATAGHFGYDTDIPPGECCADPLRIGQVFTILMENALRYATEGGKQTIQGYVQSGYWTFSFRDYGAGVEPDFLPVMFDRFTRSDVSRSRHSGGSGLGLSIARAICESHGGTLTASIPQEGNGLLFQVKLPV